MSHAEPSPTPTGTNRVSRFITGRRTAWFVALIPLFLSLGVLATVGEGERDARPTDSLPEGYDSTAAVALQQELPEEDASVAIVLWSVEDGELDEAQIGAATEQTLALLAETGAGQDAEGGQGGPPPGVDTGAGQDGPPQDGQGGPPQDGQGGPPQDGQSGQPQGPLQVAEDGSAAFAVIPVEARTASDNADAVADLRERLEEDAPEGVDVAVTGPAGIQADIAKVFDGANFRLLATTAGVVALLLIITYRSPVLWIIPLVVIGIADRLAAIVATQVMERLGMSWDESTIGILSVLVFGAGTNYALLLISRYRDELKTTESRNHAMAKALARTSEAVFSSSSTVVLGVLTLLLSVFPATRGLGAATAMGIVIAATFAMVVLSATLVLFGRWVFWPQVPKVGDATLVMSGRSIWRRVGDAVAKRPPAFIAGTLAVLALMMVGLFQIQTGLRPADQFLETPEAISAGERLAESFPAGTTDPVQVLTRQDPDEVIGVVQGVDGVTSARVSAEGAGVAQVDGVLEAAPGSDQAKDAVRDLREALAGLDETYVGGGDAESLDEADASARDRWLILPLILALVLGALILLLRSLVAPILLVTTVLFTFAAAMGTSWWAFRYLFDFPALDYGVPLLAFLFLVALGVDYNIFLVTRAREEAAEHGTRDGMLRALTATGGVITSAGILLAAVFAVLGVLPLVVLAQLGAIIFVGVLLDTLIVRTVLVPALAITLGDRFWWPRKVGPREATHEEAGDPSPERSTAAATR